MAILFTNNAKSTLAGAITAVQTTFSVASGDGALFPSPAGSDYFLVTLVKLTGGVPVYEICQCTGRAGDVLTVVRGQEGTTATTFSVSDKVELRVTAAVITEMMQSAENLGDVGDAQTSFNNIKQDATETTTGVVEKATTAESEAGTEANKFPDVVGVKAAIDAQIDAQRPYASQAEAEAGTENTKVMTALRSSQAINAKRPYASQAEAEAGTENTKVITPLRVSQAIASDRTFGLIKTKGTTLQAQDDYDRSPLFVDGTDFTAGAGPHVITVPTDWTPSNADMRFYREDASGIITALTPTATTATTFTLAETLLSTDNIFIGDDDFRNQFDGDPTDIKARLGLSIPDAIPNHVRAGNTQLADGSAASSEQYSLKNVSVGTTATYGPTGSGADVILPVMDNFPSNATVMLVLIRLTLVTTSTTEATIRCYASKGDVTLDTTGVNYVANCSVQGAIGDRDAQTTLAMIPLDSNNIFKFRYEEFNATAAQGFLVYKGFMTDFG